MQKLLFLPLLCLVIALHWILLSIEHTQEIKVVDKHVKVQHITLTKMVLKQKEVHATPPKKVIKKRKKKKKVKHKKPVKRVIKRVKELPKKEKIVKKEIPKKVEVVQKRDTTPKEQKFIPKKKKPKVSPSKESMATLKDKYISQIRDEIRKNLIYPSMARRMRIEGIIYVAFRVNKTGEVDNIQVTKGNKSILKRAAQKTLKKIVLKAIPPELGVEKLELSLPISFKIKKG